MAELDDSEDYTPPPTGALRTQLNNGRYLLFGMLGVGGMATVYRCWDTELMVWRAAKVLLADLRTRESVRERFKREARAMAAIDHPNVARVFDVGEDAGVPFIVLEMLDGGSLESWLAENGQMDEALAIHTMLEVCEGVEAAHRAGLIHRDIKPDNLMVDRNGRCKVTDFGIAGGAAAASQTRTGVAMGTLDYMAPEQREDAKNVGKTADVYALGCTLFALLTDATPANLFVAASDESRLAAAPESLRAVIAKATMYKAAERYQDCGELKAALRAVQDGLYDPTVDPSQLLCEQEPLPDPETHASFTTGLGPRTAPSSPPDTMSGPTMHLPEQDPATTLVQDTDPDPVPAPVPAAASEPSSNRTPLAIAALGLLLLGIGSVATGVGAFALTQSGTPAPQPSLAEPALPIPEPVAEPVESVPRAAADEDPGEDAVADPGEDAIEDEDPGGDLAGDAVEDPVEPEPEPEPAAAAPSPAPPAPTTTAPAPRPAPQPAVRPEPTPPPPAPAADAPRVGSAMVVVKDGTGLVVTCGDTTARGTASARLRDFPAGSCTVAVSFLGKPFETRVRIESRREVHCQVQGEALACR